MNIYMYNISYIDALHSHLWLQVVGQHLNRVPNVKAPQVLRIFVNVVQGLNLILVAGNMVTCIAGLQVN